ncbi:chemotaxis protein CheA [bacterium]|nr:chemotaxis protein CheA [bacterium]
MSFDEHKELINDYIEDTNDFLDDLDNLIFDLEKNKEGDFGLILGEILSSLHTFKGNSGMMGFDTIQSLAHSLEDLFNAFQTGQLSLSDASIDFVRTCFSRLRDLINNLDPVAPQRVDLTGEIRNIQDYIASGQLPIPEAHGKNVRKAPTQGIQNVRSQRLSNVLKVNLDRLDNLLNLMGELVIYRTRLGQIGTQFKDELGERGLVLDLGDTFEQIDKVSTELYEAIMKVRMLPLQQVFLKFPPLARNLTKGTGKDVTLLFEGEETELDKRVIDEIGEPLLHLIRNAIDHGIEPVDERLAKGKPAQGTIKLQAQQESSYIILTIEDDGRGIDFKKLRQKANLLGIQDNEDYQTNDTDLLFISGLSTAQQVTETSGRGIGMDVVRKSLEKINGSIEVTSEPDIYTRFTLKLPLTLAIISALLVEVAGEFYAVPLSAVVESLKMQIEEVSEVNQCKVATIRESILPLIDLGQFFEHKTLESDQFYVVVVQGSSRKIGLMVDRLLGRQDIVIKPLDDYFGLYQGITGASILGDGTVILILDIHAFIENKSLVQIEQKVSSFRQNKE